MDIAKIRKRLKEAKEAKKAGEKPEDLAPSGVGKPEDLAQDIPAELHPPDEREPFPIEQISSEHIPPEAEASEAEASENRLVGEELLAPEEGPLTPGEDALPGEAASIEEGPMAPEEKPPVTAAYVPEVPGVAEDELVELLTFKLSKEDYAFRVSDVEEILRPQRYANVPKADGFILGITSLRGKIIPLVDLRLRFGFKVEGAVAGEGAAGMKPKILILKGPRGSIGALVDRVVDVIRIPPGEIAEPPSNLSEAEAKFIEGVALSEERFISVVRLEEAMNFNVSEGGQ